MNYFDMFWEIGEKLISLADALKNIWTFSYEIPVPEILGGAIEVSLIGLFGGVGLLVVIGLVIAKNTIPGF